jgi:hypothetical protein
MKIEDAIQIIKYDREPSALLALVSGLVCVAVVVFAVFLRWGGISFSIKLTDIMNVLSPLILTAGFIERAVEVLVSPWRDAGATTFQNAVDSAKAATVPDPTRVQQAKDDLTKYKGTTQRYAFATSLTLGLAIGIAGVRSLWPLLDTTKFNSLSTTQQHYFLVADLVLTAALLAGGADGIHSVVEAFTSYFDVSAKKTQQAAR